MTEEEVAEIIKTSLLELVTRPMTTAHEFTWTGSSCNATLDFLWGMNQRQTRATLLSTNGQMSGTIQSTGTNCTKTYVLSGSQSR